MWVTLEPGLVVVYHLLSGSGVHRRIPAVSQSFFCPPAAPPHGPDTQECVGGVTHTDTQIRNTSKINMFDELIKFS